MTFEKDVPFKIYEQTQMIIDWELSFKKIIYQFFLSQFSQNDNTYMK